RPVQSRMAARSRYGPVFRSNDLIAGEVFHIADRALMGEMFKWKPAEYNVGEPRQVMEPVTGPSSILLLDGERRMRIGKLMVPRPAPPGAPVSPRSRMCRWDALWGDPATPQRGRARHARRHPRAAAVRARRGRPAADRWGAARRVDHAAAGGKRDDRDVNRLG